VSAQKWSDSRFTAESGHLRRARENPTEAPGGRDPGKRCGAMGGNVLDKRAVFQRDATGLVREASTFDAFMMNFACNGPIGFAIAWSVMWALYAIPGTDMILAMFIALVPAVLICVTFGMLTAAMPRSGGDYVFVSRILHPIPGLASNLAVACAQVIFTGLVAYWVSSMTLGPSFSVVGYLTGSQAWVKLSEAVVSPGWSFTIGLVVIAAVGVILAAGIKTSLKVVNVTMIIGLVGLLAVVALLVATTPEIFVAKFNAFAQAYTHQPDSYTYIINTARDSGLNVPGYHPWASTWRTLPIAVGLLAWSWWSTYISGEVKGSTSVKRQMSLMLVPTLVNGLLMILVIWLLFEKIGYTFLASATYLSTVVPSAYPFPVAPFYNLFASLISGSRVVNVLLALSFIAWPIPICITMLTMVSRSVFAWGFDGLVPYKLAEVSERYHSPTLAIGIMCALSAVCLAVTVFGGGLVYRLIAMTTMFIYLAWLIVGITGTLFPFLKPDMYRTSPANIKILGIPAITLAGGAMTVAVVWLWSLFVRHPELGTATLWANFGPSICVLVGSVIWYCVAAAIRRRQGVNLRAVYQEIPPE